MNRNPLDYKRLVNLTEFRNAAVDIRDHCEQVIEAIDKSDLQQSEISHMRAGMVISGWEIKMTNVVIAIRERFRK